MERSEATTLAARLFAFFPVTSGGREQASVYAEKLCRYPVDAVVRAVDKLAESRTDPHPPTWAELRKWVEAELPRPVELEEGDGVPMPADLWTIWSRARRRVDVHGAELES